MLNVTHVQISFLFKFVNMSYFRVRKGIRPIVVMHGSVTSIYCFELGVNIVNIFVSKFSLQNGAYNSLPIAFILWFIYFDCEETNVGF